MGKRFDPKHWPMTARTRWNRWRHRKVEIPLQPVVCIDEHGNILPDVMGFVDIPRGRWRKWLP